MPCDEDYLACAAKETTPCMTARIPPLDWSAIHWPDFRANVAADWIAVLPLAATEQHGPHLPLGTDVMIADAFLARVRELLPDDVPATFLPLQPVGISTEHIDYPGTLTLPPDVAIAQWNALGESVARAGLRKLVIVTSHGGNGAAMSLVAQELRARLGMLVVTTNWHRFDAQDGLFPDDELCHGIHGGAVETSIMLAKYPQTMRMSEAKNFAPASIANDKQNRWLSTRRPAPLAWQAQDLHASGAIGDASLASAESGHLIVDKAAQAFCDLLADVAKFDLDHLQAGPD